MNSEFNCECTCKNSKTCKPKYLRESESCPCNTCLIKSMCMNVCDDYNDFRMMLIKHYDWYEARDKFVYERTEKFEEKGIMAKIREVFNL